MKAARLIVSEKTGRWAVALRRELAGLAEPAFVLDFPLRSPPYPRDRRSRERENYRFRHDHPVGKYEGTAKDRGGCYRYSHRQLQHRCRHLRDKGLPPILGVVAAPVNQVQSSIGADFHESDARCRVEHLAGTC